MPTYSRIVIIYNPKSTGSSRQMAQEIRQAIIDRLADQPVELLPTESAGHAEDLAHDIAVKYDKPLILSSSGDGGYHEVINGIMRAEASGNPAIAGLIPAGNANDHYHATQQHALVDCIVERNIKKVDLLKFTSMVNGRLTERHGHSYIGLGISPKVGKKLNKTKINAFNQYFIAFQIIMKSQPVELFVDGRNQLYESLIFSNIDRMSRLLTLSRDARIDDGKFEVTSIYKQTKWQLIKQIFQAATLGLKGDDQVERFTFRTTKPCDIQIDGEVYRLDADSDATVVIEKQVLERII